MNSPPKKCILNQPKWGGGIPISNNNALTSHPPTVTPLTKTRFIPLPTTEALDNRFDMIRAEMQSQCEINVHFDSRIGSLEATTKQIDSKIDRILGHMESSLLSHKVQQTSSVTFQDYNCSTDEQELLICLSFCKPSKIFVHLSYP
jgi:hypothetical protein